MTPLQVLLILGVGVGGPLVWLARRRIYPHARAVRLAGLPCLLSMAVLRWPELLWPVLAADALYVLVLAIDLMSLPKPGDFAVKRTLGRIASLRRPHPVQLMVSNQSPRARALDIRDGVPDELHPEPADFHVELAGRTRATVEYHLRAGRRGAFTLDAAHLRGTSRWRLWQRLMSYPVVDTVNVYPDMRQLAEYALLARTNRLSLVGVRRTRRVGQDHDFERLRDYSVDDNYKHIDWRATARRRKLTVKDFQATQSQRIIFLADCGRMMTNQAAGLSLLDHALNSLLMLSYVALRQGDSVGLLCFSSDVHGFVPPRGGMTQMNRLLHASFDRFPQMVESRYDLAFRYLATHCRKRSLVVLITNVIDAVNAAQVQQYLGNLVGRHLPLGVMLRDRQMFDAVEADGEPTGDRLWTAGAAADVLLWRQQTIQDLKAQGVLALDVFPEQMTAPLVNQYLQIKARHLL